MQVKSTKIRSLLRFPFHIVSLFAPSLFSYHTG
ncbi:hypothetical protein RDI58_029216 [Solanum bulbocastanum]|uniref:Uncharacterized protein n=1 Tax=Solanum bulbocastanum TaxID=147425 RepID=A0AAN8STY0_SOLBU